MKLFEVAIKIRTGFSPYKKGQYVIDKSSSIQFTDNDALPKDTDPGRWKFYDGDFDQVVEGKFKESVKKTVASHKRAKGSSFSHTLKVNRVR